MKGLALPATLLLSLILAAGPCLGVEATATGGHDQPAEVAYVPDSAAIEGLRRVDRPITIVLFHGAWCQDCRREVPRFRKILELASNPNFQLIEYEVNPQKQDVLGKFEQYGIQKVPTFIFLDGEKELGRIVERPKVSLEADFLAIVGPPR